MSPPRAGGPAPPRPAVLVLVLGMLAAFGPLAIDMYLPAFPAIAADLRATSGAVGWTLAAYFAGLAIGQLVVGAASDRLGRRPPLRVGLVLFAAASVAAALAPRIEALVVARALQALGGAACAVSSRAVVRDLHRGAAAARLNSRLVLVMGLAPILGPLAGGALLAAWGWRAIFAVLAVAAVGAFAVVTVALPETAPAAAPAGARATGRALLGDRGYVAHGVILAASQAAMFAYITGAPTLYIGIHHVPPGRFGWFFGANAAGLIAASQLNARLLGRASPARLLRAGLGGLSVAGALLLVVALRGGGLWPTAAACFAFVACLGLVSPNASALALEHQGARAATAAAWLGALQFTLAAAASASVSALADGTARPVAAVIALLATIAAVVRAAATRG